MPEPSRIAAGDPRYPATAAENNLATPELDIPELPETATPANNPALNRSAEAVGRSVGNAVAGVRNLPRQIDKLRSRIHLVPSRRSGSLADAAAQTATEWRDSAEETLAELKQKAEAYTYEVTDRTNQRLEDFRQRTEWRINILRVKARHLVARARSWEMERPLVVIGSCAAGAFVLGVALRVWRSGRE